MKLLGWRSDNDTDGGGGGGGGKHGGIRSSNRAAIRVVGGEADCRLRHIQPVATHSFNCMQ